MSPSTQHRDRAESVVRGRYDRCDERCSASHCALIHPRLAWLARPAARVLWVISAPPTAMRTAMLNNMVLMRQAVAPRFRRSSQIRRLAAVPLCTSAPSPKARLARTLLLLARYGKEDHRRHSSFTIDRSPQVPRLSRVSADQTLQPPPRLRGLRPVGIERMRRQAWARRNRARLVTSFHAGTAASSRHHRDQADVLAPPVLPARVQCGTDTEHISVSGSRFGKQRSPA